MNPTMRGFVYGTLGVAGLYVLLAAASGTAAQADRVTSLFALPAEMLSRFIDPTVPALHKGSRPASTNTKHLPGSNLLSGVLNILVPGAGAVAKLFGG